MLIDHEMCVQFVGDRSSPACGNYTLQKDTYRWKSRVGENAEDGNHELERMQWKFYEIISM